KKDTGSPSKRPPASKSSARSSRYGTVPQTWPRLVRGFSFSGATIGFRRAVYERYRTVSTCRQVFVGDLTGLHTPHGCCHNRFASGVYNDPPWTKRIR